MTYKNIAAIAAETEKLKVKYLRPFDFARAVALTEFLRQLEQEHEDFKLLTVHPNLAVNRDKQDEPVFTMGLWAKFSIAEVVYYLEINENPFFNAYFSKSWEFSPKMAKHEYLDLAKMNDTLYEGIEWSATPETINRLVKNLHLAFEQAKVREVETYTKEIPAYERGSKQEIYY